MSPRHLDQDLQGLTVAARLAARGEPWLARCTEPGAGLMAANEPDAESHQAGGIHIQGGATG